MWYGQELNYKNFPLATCNFIILVKFHTFFKSLFLILVKSNVDTFIFGNKHHSMFTFVQSKYIRNKYQTHQSNRLLIIFFLSLLVNRIRRVVNPCSRDLYTRMLSLLKCYTNIYSSRIHFIFYFLVQRQVHRISTK